MPGKPSKELNAIWRLGFVLLAAGAWIVFAWQLAAPSESGSAVLLGYSMERLALATAALLLAAVFSWLTWRSRSDSSWLAKSISGIQTTLKPASRFWFALALAILLLFASWVLFFLPAERAASFIGSYSLYLNRLRPLLFFGILFGVMSAGLLIFQRYGLDAKAVHGGSKVLHPTLFILIFLLLISGLLLATGLGLGFDATIWNAPGAPVLSTQVFLCLLFAPLVLTAGFGFRRRFPKAILFKRLDLTLAALVWLLAAILWLHQPAQPTYYSSILRPPNFESYPLSDAFNHDVIANNVLVGQGFHFGGLVAIRRPLYVMFLAGLEVLLGPNYDLVVSAQVIVLALFPALLYLLGTKLHNRFSGLLLGGLITFRETNSIALGHVVNMSHVKLLMADLPTALGMAALGLAAVVWLRGSPRNGVAAMLTGGLMGAFILLRSQTLTLIPFFILLAVLVWGWRGARKQALLFVVGVALVASPWIIRNRVQMGQWAIEDSVVSGFLANRYRFEPGTFGLPFLAGETEGEYYARQMASVREFALQNPGYVAGFAADNFVRNELLNFMVMPVSLQLRDLESHVRQLPYWPSWDGRLAAESALPMLANLFFVSLGLVVAWRQARWVGLVPLFINIGFTLNLALARVSGWRYNLPVDWTALLYYALGIGQLFLWSILVLQGNSRIKKFVSSLSPERIASSPQNRISRLPTKAQWVVSLSALLLLGNSFLIIEALAQPRYHKLSFQEANVILDSAGTQIGDESKKTQLEEMLTRGQLEILNGRALYPSFYRAGEGVADSDFALTMPLDFKHVTFYLIGPEAASVVLRVDTQQLDFPSGSDVLVLSCGDSALEAAAIVVTHPDQRSELIISSDLAAACPTLGLDVDG
jgi:hypothetical protein